MSEPATLPAGMVLCPGWTSSEDQTVHKCDEGRVDSPQLVKKLIGNPPQMCGRCRRRMTKYDTEHGRAERERAEGQLRFERQIGAYVTALRKARPGAGTVGATFGSLDAGDLEAIAQLREREQWRPEEEPHQFARPISESIAWAVAQMALGITPKRGRFQ